MALSRLHRGFTAPARVDPLTELRVLAARKRSSGSVTIHRKAAARKIGALDYVDEYIVGLGFNAIGRNWVQINRVDAVSLMRLAMQKNLSSKRRVMGSWSARHVTKRFLSQFEKRNVQFYTNVAYHSGNFHVWQPISRSPYDMGVVAFDMSSIGILCVQDAG